MMATRNGIFFRMKNQLIKRLKFQTPNFQVSFENWQTVIEGFNGQVGLVQENY